MNCVVLTIFVNQLIHWNDLTQKKSWDWNHQILYIQLFSDLIFYVLISLCNVSI